MPSGVYLFSDEYSAQLRQGSYVRSFNEGSIQLHHHINLLHLHLANELPTPAV